jgi:putative membrane protein
VRTVELTASPIHRLLGLAKVEVGTGSGAQDGDSRLVLDSLGVAEGRRLREELLHRRPTAEPAAAVDVPDRVIMRLDPSWVRYAPLTTSGVVIALAALGGGSQLVGNAIERVASSSTLDDRLQAVPLPVAILAGLVVFVVVTSVLASVGYLVANWGFTLSRDASGRSFHVRRGLLTTRETSIDVARVRGLEIHEPLGLRLVGGGGLNAVVTGLRRRGTERTVLVPPAPRAIVVGVGEQVLDEAGPLATPLVPHGPAARRRRHLRALTVTSVVPVALAALAVLAGWPAWLAVLGLLAPLAGAWVAEDRYAGLGHALTDRYLVVRSGSFQGRRDALQRTGIIGWNIRQSWFQRRAGLVTLCATTAAGKQVYHALDVPESTAVALADAAVPGLVSQFVELGVPEG